MTRHEPLSQWVRICNLVEAQHFQRTSSLALWRVPADSLRLPLLSFICKIAEAVPPDLDAMPRILGCNLDEMSQSLQKLQSNSNNGGSCIAAGLLLMRHMTTSTLERSFDTGLHLHKIGWHNSRSVTSNTKHLQLQQPCFASRSDHSLDITSSTSDWLYR